MWTLNYWILLNNLHVSPKFPVCLNFECYESASTFQTPRWTVVIARKGVQEDYGCPRSWKDEEIIKFDD